MQTGKNINIHIRVGRYNVNTEYRGIPKYFNGVPKRGRYLINITCLMRQIPAFIHVHLRWPQEGTLSKSSEVAF